jgi:DNA-binding CsgD family transcriptional regulator
MLLRLSRREREVLELIIEGHTDKEIADRLYISPRTVTTHVTHILNKLGVGSRGEAAELAAGNSRLTD